MNDDDEKSDLKQQHDIQLRNAKLIRTSLQKDQERHHKTLMNILLLLSVNRKQCHIPSFQFSLLVTSEICMF
jgi:hypothetical protein